MSGGADFYDAARAFLLPSERGSVGRLSARHRHVGSYVPSAVYGPGRSTVDVGVDPSRARSLGLPNPMATGAEARGLSSWDVTHSGGYAQARTRTSLGAPSPYLKGNARYRQPWTRAESQGEVHFEDTLIDQPQSVAHTDEMWGTNFTVITQNKNQSRDLRGDIAPTIQGLPPTAVPTFGAFGLSSPYRPYVL